MMLRTQFNSVCLSTRPRSNSSVAKCSNCGGDGSVQLLNWSNFSCWLSQHRYRIPDQLFEAEDEFERSQEWETRRCPDCLGQGQILARNR